MGLKNGPPTHEIGYGQFIQLDLTSLLATLPKGNNGATITIGSVQQGSGDAYAIYSSSIAGQLGTEVASGNYNNATGSIATTTTTINLTNPGFGPYLDVTETGYNDNGNAWNSGENKWDWQTSGENGENGGQEMNETGSVLLSSLSISPATPTPEPASLAMMSIVGLGILLLPRKKAARA